MTEKLMICVKQYQQKENSNLQTGFCYSITVEKVKNYAALVPQEYFLGNEIPAGNYMLNLMPLVMFGKATNFLPADLP
ncbi:MAG: hypothetical protein ABJB86_01145 [Bacteroidota bacterium]